MVALKAREKQLKDDQKKHLDRHHGVRDLTQLMPGDLVWMPDRETEAVVEEEVAPRSYNVSTPGGTLRWNRRNLIRVPEGPVWCLFCVKNNNFDLYNVIRQYQL